MVALRHTVEVAPTDGRLWTGLARMCVVNYSMELLPEAQVPIEDALKLAALDFSQIAKSQ
jgi:hypothetical protein